MVFLSNLRRFLIRRDSQVRYAGLDERPGRDCVRFMVDSLFFEQHIGKKLSPRSAPRVTAQPLREVRQQDSHSWIRLQLVPWLSRCSGVAERDLAELQTCVSELFNNIADHTEHDVGSVFAQWFPNEKQLEVCVADFGAGVPSTVRRVAPDLSDAEAIARAFEDGFTSKSISTNRDVGLHYLKQNVVENLEGILKLHSAGGSVEIKKCGTRTRVVSSQARGYCPGTLVEIRLRTDLIEASDDEPEAFEW